MHFQKNVGGVVTDEKSLQLCLCKKKLIKKNKNSKSSFIVFCSIHLHVRFVSRQF